MGKPAALVGALVSLSLTGCVAPLMMAPAMLSMGASAAARSAAARQQQSADGTAPKLQMPWVKKTTNMQSRESGQ